MLPHRLPDVWPLTPRIFVNVFASWKILGVKVHPSGMGGKANKAHVQWPRKKKRFDHGFLYLISEILFLELSTKDLHYFCLIDSPESLRHRCNSPVQLWWSRFLQRQEKLRALPFLFQFLRLRTKPVKFQGPLCHGTQLLCRLCRVLVAQLEASVSCYFTPVSSCLLLRSGVFINNSEAYSIQRKEQSRIRYMADPE